MELKNQCPKKAEVLDHDHDQDAKTLKYNEDQQNITQVFNL